MVRDSHPQIATKFDRRDFRQWGGTIAVLSLVAVFCFFSGGYQLCPSHLKNPSHSASWTKLSISVWSVGRTSPPTKVVAKSHSSKRFFRTKLSQNRRDSVLHAHAYDLFLSSCHRTRLRYKQLQSLWSATSPRLLRLYGQVCGEKQFGQTVLVKPSYVIGVLGPASVVTGPVSLSLDC